MAHSSSAIALRDADQGAGQGQRQRGVCTQQTGAPVACAAAPITDVGSGQGDGRSQHLHDRHRCAGLLLLIRAARGSAAAIKTPTACCVSTSHEERISPATRSRTRTRSRCASTNAPRKTLGSKHLPIDSGPCCNDQLNPPPILSKNSSFCLDEKIRGSRRRRRVSEHGGPRCPTTNSTTVLLVNMSASTKRHP